MGRGPRDPPGNRGARRRVPRKRRAAGGPDSVLGSMSSVSTLFTFPLTGFGSAFRRHRRPVSKSVCDAQTEATSHATRRGVFESQLTRSRSADASPGVRETPAYIVVMEGTHGLKSIPDDELLRRLAELLRQSRRVEADLVAHIGEVDSRRLYARSASPSMFAYCTEVLHLSEAEAYLRIAAARASREHPTRPGDAGRRPSSPDRHREAGAAPDSGEPRGAPAAGRPQVQARDRGAGRGAGAPTGCTGGHAKAARTPGTGAVGADPGTRSSPVGVGPPPRCGWNGNPQRAPSGRSWPSGWTLGHRNAQARTASGRSWCITSPGPGPARSRGAPRSGPLQGPIHRLRSASRQDRAAPEASCAPRYPTATWPPSSSKPSARSWNGSNPGASLEPERPGRRARRAARPRRRARSQPPSNEPYTSATEAGATMWTDRGDVALRARGSSSITDIRSAAAVTTPWRTSRSCVGPTTPTWPRSTTAEAPWRCTAARGNVSSTRPRLPRCESIRVGRRGVRKIGRAFATWPSGSFSMTSRPSGPGCLGPHEGGCFTPAGSAAGATAGATDGARVKTRDNVIPSQFERGRS